MGIGTMGPCSPSVEHEQPLASPKAQDIRYLVCDARSFRQFKENILGDKDGGTDE